MVFSNYVLQGLMRAGVYLGLLMLLVIGGVIGVFLTLLALDIVFSLIGILEYFVTRRARKLYKDLVYLFTYRD